MTKAQAKRIRWTDRVSIPVQYKGCPACAGTVYAIAGDAEDAKRLAAGCEWRGQHADARELRETMKVGLYPMFYVLDGWTAYRWYTYRDIEAAEQPPKPPKPLWRKLHPGNL